ncbi:MAG: Maf family protein, partial [Vulcanimicrobiaceae bacterium]
MTTISHVLLASASPRRRELLASLGLGVTVVPSGFEEHDDDRSIAPRALATINALGKRDAVGIATD